MTAGDAARLTASAGACCSESDDDELRSTSATVVNDSRASRGSVGAVCLLTCYVVAGRSGLVVSASDCDVRGPRFESRRRRLYLSRQTLRYTYSLGHGLRTFAVVPRSTQPTTLRGTVKRVSAYGLSNNNNGDGGCGGCGW